MLQKTINRSSIITWHGQRVRAVAGFHSGVELKFLFKRPSPPDSTRVFKDMLQAKDNDRLDLVAKLYPQLVSAQQKQLQQSQPSTSSSTAITVTVAHSRLQSIMRFVASTNRFSLLLRMFNDLPTVFNFPQTALDHHILLLGMTRSGKVNRAFEWIQSMPATHDLQPSTSDWNIVLGGYRNARDSTGIEAVINRMQQLGYKPNSVTYNTLISAWFELGQLDKVRHTVQEMATNGIKPDLWTETALLTGFIDAGELASARQVHERLRVAVDHEQERQGGHVKDTAAVNALIKYETAQQGFEAGLHLARQYRDRGVSLDAWTMNTLAVEAARNEIKDSTDAVRLIERLEITCELEADRRTWSTVIRGVLAGPGGVDEALQVHQEARDRSVEPDSTMIQPLLNALLLPSPTPETLEVARSLYDDLSQASRAYHTSPDISIYVSLLRACADPTHPDLEYSRTLIADMRDRGLRFDGPSLTWHIVALMRAASNYEEAFQAYDQMRVLDPSALDTTSAYNTILAAFTSLRFRDPSGDAATVTQSQSRSPLSSSPPPPTAMIGEILSDMRHSSPPAPPDSTTYSQLLSFYSKGPGGTTGSSSGGGPGPDPDAVKHIAHLHSLIKLDSNLDPDTPLFNALMSAYSRVGAHAAAERIWDTLRANASSASAGAGAGAGGPGSSAGPRVDARSVSTALDACGFAGAEVEAGTGVGSFDSSGTSQSHRARALARADRIWSDLRDGSLVVRTGGDGPGDEGSGLGDRGGGGGSGPGRIHYKIWGSYVECLCRLGEFDRAEEVVFRDMVTETTTTTTRGSAQHVGHGRETPSSSSQDRSRGDGAEGVVETLLKMVRRAEDGDVRWERVRDRVRRGDVGPGVWDRVKGVAMVRSFDRTSS